MMGKKNKIILIGWDAADWRVITPLVEQGLMPTLKALVENGAYGNLATLDPSLSPMLWTSIATGKTADKHGVLGFVEPDSENNRLRPVLGTTRKGKALWNILTQKGYRTHVVGWWPSHPAEPVNGVYVSNFYHRATASYGEPWPLADGCIHPPNLGEVLARYRVHPAELTAAHLLPFVPRAAEIDQEKDKSLISIAKIIADAASIHAAATWIMENEPWDFMTVYYDAIDHFGHGFMRFHPPRQKAVPEKLYEQYKNVVTAGYRFHDMMLERLIQLAGPDTTVILISDHGFHPDHLRSIGIPKEPAGAASEHRELGIIAMQGPSILPGERIFGANLLDIAPTILTLMDLPIGADMDGKPLLEIFRDPPQPEIIPSWEAVPGESGMHPPDHRRDPWAEQQMMEQLIALGYIDPPGEKEKENIEKWRRESQYNLARVYLSTGRLQEAIPIFETLYEEAPDQDRFGLRLAHCYLQTSKLPQARKMVEEIIARKEKSFPALDLLQGTLCLAEDQPERAIEYLNLAAKNAPPQPGIHIRIGRAYLKLAQYHKAENAFREALELDSDNAQAFHGLSMTYLRQEKYEQAVETGLDATSRIYFMPAAHFHIGQALTQLGEYEHAAHAFQVATHQAPGMKRAHLALARLYNTRLGRPDLAAEIYELYRTKN